MGLFDLFKRKPPAAESVEAPSSAQPSAEPVEAPSSARPPATDQADWQRRLLEHVRECHAARPVPTRDAMDPLQRAMLAGEGGFLTTWLRQHGPRMLDTRRVLLEFRGEVSPGPLVVLRGDAPAVAAMLIITRGEAKTGERQLVALLDDDYDAFIRANPEAREFDFHVSTWSRFVPAAPELLARARELGKSIDPARTYYNHVNGTLWGPRHGLQVENLWSWDGSTLDLVEEAIAHHRY